MTYVTSDFIRTNRELWSRIGSGRGSKGLLLVAPGGGHPQITHGNAVFARIIKEARGLDIGWIDSGGREIQELLLSYDPESITIPQLALTRLEKLQVIHEFIKASVRILFTGDILGFRINGIRFGDILYDSYLWNYKAATISKINKGILNELLSLIVDYHRYWKMLRHYGASAVLTGDPVGRSGVLFRTALACGCEAYARSGGRQASFCRFTSPSEIYDYSVRPRKVEVQLLSRIAQDVIMKQFDETMAEVMRWSASHDSKAFHKDKRIYFSKNEFVNDFGGDPSGQFIFVMLHAFNDCPHSNFGWMIFKDYYDWFVQTLEFARRKKNVTWVFKEHPDTLDYIVRDISLPDHFRAKADHIVFLNGAASVSTQSLLYLADAIITTEGSAGLLFPALKGIPSIIAGRSFYSGFGFTVEPRTKEEYFQVLDKIDTKGKLTIDQQQMAQRVFLYCNRYGTVPFNWCLQLPYEEVRNPNIADYWDRIRDLYSRESAVLIQQFNEYVERVKRSDFSRLAEVPWDTIDA